MYFCFSKDLFLTVFPAPLYNRGGVCHSKSRFRGEVRGLHLYLAVVALQLVVGTCQHLPESEVPAQVPRPSAPWAGGVCSKTGTGHHCAGCQMAGAGGGGGCLFLTENTGCFHGQGEHPQPRCG